MELHKENKIYFIKVNEMESIKPRCSHCDSGEVYVKRSGTIVCRRCGKETKKEKAGEPSNA